MAEIGGWLGERNNGFVPRPVWVAEGLGETCRSRMFGESCECSGLRPVLAANKGLGEPICRPCELEDVRERCALSEVFAGNDVLGMICLGD